MTRIALALLLTSGLTGCIFTDLTVIRPRAEPVGRVSVAVTSAPGVMTDEQASRLRPMLTSALATGGVKLASLGEPGAGALEGIVDAYDPGNRTLRYFFSIFGAGVGRFRSEWHVKNAAGVDIGACRVDGTIRAGWFGGSYTELLEEVGQELNHYLTDPPGRKRK